VKKIHKKAKWYSTVYKAWVYRPICKIDNKGAYTATQNWDKVDCVNCLAKQVTTPAKGEVNETNG